MKNLIFVYAFLLSVSVYGQGACNNQTSITHQGYEYEIVEIGDQCWFSENCRYLPEVSPSSASSTTTPYYYVYGYEGTDLEAAKANTNYDTFGVLYNLPAVMAEGICPSGWHVPLDEEWPTMEFSIGMSESDALSTGDRGRDELNTMKSTSGWDDGGNGSNSSGFNGLPGGWRAFSGFEYNGRNGGWWSSSESGSSGQRLLSYDVDVVYRNYANPYYGFSARCVQD